MTQNVKAVVEVITVRETPCNFYFEEKVIVNWFIIALLVIPRSDILSFQVFFYTYKKYKSVPLLFRSVFMEIFETAHSCRNQIQINSKLPLASPIPILRRISTRGSCMNAAFTTCFACFVCNINKRCFLRAFESCKYFLLNLANLIMSSGRLLPE